MDKITLRNEFKKIRKNILNKNAKSDLIQKYILTTEQYKKSQIIGCYVSLPDEVNTLDLIDKMIKDNKIVCVPKVISANEMCFYKINNLNDLKKGFFDILEPYKGNIIDNMDLMIIPGICFDLQKNRIGFGKGFYDNYLRKHKTIKIGICYDEQIAKHLIENSSNDIKMDIIITDKRKIK